MSNDRADKAVRGAQAGATGAGATAPDSQKIVASFAVVGLELAAARAESLARSLRRLAPHAPASAATPASNPVSPATQPGLDPRDADARDAAFDQQFGVELRRFAEAAPRHAR